MSESPIELAGSGSVPVGAAVFAGPSPRPAAGRRRVGALLGTVAGAALLVAGAAGCSSSSGGGSGTLSQPDKIASLKKSQDQSMAKEILKAAKGHTGGGKLTAVVYQDGSDSSKTVMVYGGVGIPLPSGDTGSQFTSMLGSGTEVGGGVKVGTVADVDAGSAGGNAKCAPILASGGGDSKFVNCAWINGKSALVLTFQSYSADDARTLLPQILTAMTKG